MQNTLRELFIKEPKYREFTNINLKITKFYILGLHNSITIWCGEKDFDKSFF